MSTLNIGFNEDLTKIIFQLSPNMHLISSSGFRAFYNPVITHTAAGEVCCQGNTVYN